MLEKEATRTGPGLGQGRLESVQMLRGIAAMLVVYNHAGLLVLKHEAALGSSLLAPSAEFALLGSIGVDLFFVISGFVMALNARTFDGRAGALAFISLRFVRIAPLFYLFCLVILVDLLLAGVHPSRGTILNSVFFLPLFDKFQYSWPLHYLGWTLAFEVIFYMIVATLIAAGRGRDAGAILLAVLALPLLGYAAGDGLVLWKMVTNPILWEFALGIIAFKLWQLGVLSRARIPLLAMVTVALGAIAYSASQGVTLFDANATVLGDDSAARFLVWGVPALGVFCLALGFGDLMGGPAGALLKSVGDASYSIYLSHLFVVRLAQWALERWQLPPDGVVLATFAGSAVVGIVVYRLLENPMLRIGRSWLSVVSRQVAAPGRAA